MTKLSDNQASKLSVIVTATNSAKQCTFMTEKSVQVLVDAGYAECNNTMTDPNDAKKVAVRATPTGLAYDHDAATAESTEPMEKEPAQTARTEPLATEAVAPAFKIMSGRTVPAITRKGASTSLYPFDALAVGQSFFVPATAVMTNPSKSLASTVSSAAKRYATETGTRTINRKVEGVMTQVEVKAYTYARKFTVRAVTLDGVDGAEVFRVAIPGLDDQSPTAE